MLTCRNVEVETFQLSSAAPGHVPVECVCCVELSVESWVRSRVQLCGVNEV
jgi:hypothetical protein